MARAPEKSTTDLMFEELDRTAIELLKSAQGGALEMADGDDTLPSAKTADEPTLRERIAIFTAVGTYAKSRLATGPQPTKGTSKFDELRNKYRGSGAGTGDGSDSPPKRGANRAKKAQANGSAGTAFDA